MLSNDSAAAWDRARCYHWGFYTRGNDLSNSSESEAAGRGVQPTLTYWQVLAFRLLLVLVFTYGVLLITSLIAYLIPDKPGDVDEQEHREKYLTQQLVLQSVRARPSNVQHSASATDAGPVKRTSKQQQLLFPSAAAQPQDAPNSRTIGLVEPPAPGFVIAWNLAMREFSLTIAVISFIPNLLNFAVQCTVCWQVTILCSVS